MGKTTQVTQIVQKTLAKTTFVHTQIVVLPSHPQNITKNGFATENVQVKWGKMTHDEQLISETFYGFHVGKQNPFYSPTRGSILPLIVKLQNQKFPTV